jgi:hypothetical protein
LYGKIPDVHLWRRRHAEYAPQFQDAQHVLDRIFPDRYMDNVLTDPDGTRFYQLAAKKFPMPYYENQEAVKRYMKTQRDKETTRRRLNNLPL